MKVLWFTNIPMPGMVGQMTKNHFASGGWMFALMEQLTQIPTINLNVCCISPGLMTKTITINSRLTYYPINQGAKRRVLGYKDLDMEYKYLEDCANLANELMPDIIHIHGTERFYGLLGARKLVESPIIISLQGLLNDYVRPRNYFGVSNVKDVILTEDIFHLLRGMGTLPSYFRLRKSAKREIEILSNNNWFIGRTTYDKSHLSFFNPNSNYFSIAEILRTPFYDNYWEFHNCKKQRIIFTNGNTFRRGTEIILDAVAVLKNEFPNVELILIGEIHVNPYGKRLVKKIKRLDIQNNVIFLGKLNAQQIVDELKKAHIFAIPSLIENSPNSLCEAQLMGVPCVASYSGGIPSLVSDNETGLLFPPGDTPLFIEQVRRIFNDENLAKNLSAKTRTAALKRHNISDVTNLVVKAYETVINSN